MTKMKKGYIVLEDGQIFEGQRFGYDGNAVGELVFNTSAVGYIETLTDACYRGQILMQTFPLIGNYGWINEDADGREISLSGYIVREWCESPSNFRCNGTLDEELVRRKIPGICGVDTRHLTKVIRENGVMNAAICSDPSEIDLSELKAYKISNALANSGISGEVSVFSAENDTKKVTVINYGEYLGIIPSLTQRGCSVTVVPYTYDAEAILATNPDGIVLSNGAGDPKENNNCIETVRKLIGKKPIFGISLGHQILAIAKGADTYKLKYGHRGTSQPVKDKQSGKTYITSQNHGYAVDTDSAIKCGGTVTFVNGNDGTNEGLEYKEDNAFSVQFVPEKGFGTENTENLLFNKFVNTL